MPRRKLRKIVAPLVFSGYKPYGVNCKSEEHIELLYEEYEAIKLADYEHMDHQYDPALLGVSRPTFAKIYKGAGVMIAQALAEAKEINAVYGNAFVGAPQIAAKELAVKYLKKELSLSSNYCDH